MAVEGGSAGEVGVVGKGGADDGEVEATPTAAAWLFAPQRPKERLRLRVLPKKSEVARKKKQPCSGTSTRKRMTETRMTKLDKGRSQQAKDLTSTNTGS